MKKEQKLQNNKTSITAVNIIAGIFDGFILTYMVCIIILPFLFIQPTSILWTGFAFALLVGIIYGLSRYFSEIAEIKHHHPALSQIEIEKEFALLKNIGIEDQLNIEMQTKMQEERELWLKEVIDNGLGWETTDKKRALKSGLQTGISFFVSGVISLIFVTIISYNYYGSGMFNLKNAFIVLTFPSLFLFLLGGLKARFLENNLWNGAFRSLIYGIVMIIIAICIAYFILKMKG